MHSRNSVKLARVGHAVVRKCPVMHWAVLLITALVSLASVAQTKQLDLPDMGASAYSNISRAEEE